MAADPKVKVERNPAGEVEVLVYSQMRPGQVRRVTLNQKTFDACALRRWTAAQAVSIFAGAAAEHLCERNGEAFDPSKVAAAATAAYNQLLAWESKLVLPAVATVH